MFTQPTPPSPGFFPPLTPSTTAPPASPSSPGRGSRLRGLIHLHLLSRDTSSLVHHNRTVPQDTSTSAPSIQPASPTTTPAAPHEVDSDPLNTADPNDDSRTHRRRASRFSEAASEALLNSRSESNPLVENQEHSSNANMTRTRSATTSDVAHDVLPTIRFSAFFDTRSNRPSLSFTPISRTLPTGKETIKVGRYSERENHALVPINTPSAAPVGFKSKVVSRRHCEFWFEKGKWYIKDVKSSSGTFLNHIRLSAPGTESKPFPINDGDIVQLGIDFKGGEEMIYRCVKMRIELNRGWQSKPNTFKYVVHHIIFVIPEEFSYLALALRSFVISIRRRWLTNQQHGNTQALKRLDVNVSFISPCAGLLHLPKRDSSTYYRSERYQILYFVYSILIYLSNSPVNRSL